MLSIQLVQLKSIASTESRPLLHTQNSSTMLAHRTKPTSVHNATGAVQTPMPQLPSHPNGVLDVHTLHPPGPPPLSSRVLPTGKRFHGVMHGFVFYVEAVVSFATLFPPLPGLWPCLRSLLTCKLIWKLGNWDLHTESITHVNQWKRKTAESSQPLRPSPSLIRHPKIYLQVKNDMLEYPDMQFRFFSGQSGRWRRSAFELVQEV